MELTEELLNQICNGVKNCLSPEESAAIHGAAPRFFRKWAAQGRKDQAAQRESLHARFLDELERSRLIGMGKLVLEVKQNPDWRAKQFLLEQMKTAKSSDSAQIIPLPETLRSQF